MTGMSAPAPVDAVVDYAPDEEREGYDERDADDAEVV